ncbi:MAG TPA: hypothetical protein VKE74_28675 [Gemmataceae bacterium]|nr:hypothetical protein [Gemmataceae bacterium]
MTGPADPGEVERVAVLRGERVIDPGRRVSATGRLLVIDLPSGS